MQQLSVVIITYNEERNIERLLLSVRELADDIVVLDSFSTDRTADICSHYAVNFVQRKWEGYAASKNYANAQAKYDWILSMDADEALSDELKNSILELKKKEKVSTASFNRLTNYCGKWIRHCGWYPDTKLRLFDRRITKWEGLIHEQLVMTPPQEVIHLKGDCLHYSYYNLQEHYAQTEKFTTLSANDLFQKGKKTNILKIYMSPFVKFLQMYFLKLGILDGYYGFMVCRISAYSSYLKYSKLLKLYKK